MKLTEQRCFTVKKAAVTLFVSIPEVRSILVDIISHHYPGNRMRFTRKGETRLRRLLDALSPQLRIGQRIDRPMKGIDYVEAISIDAYSADYQEYQNRRQVARECKAEKIRVKRKARKQGEKLPNEGKRRIELDL